jgi:hypothetical protein
VGGVGADGTSVLASMEIVDPSSRTVRTVNVAQLATARSSPTVLLLASGEILVVGGFDGSGKAVDTLEWFSADVSKASRLPAALVTGQAQSAAALEGGGALVVIAAPRAQTRRSTTYGWSTPTAPSNQRRRSREP